MAGRFQAPRGTFDVLPDAAASRQTLEDAAHGILTRAGYGLIETPAFEDTELFERGVGQSTDIVQKEMFTFSDQGGRSLTLRPEGTAPICRAFVEHGMHKLALPVKLYYLGPFFRHERPQAGRFREFHQVGAEVIGTDSPLADAEVIMLFIDLLGELGVPGIELHLGSLGSTGARAEYLEELKSHLHDHEGELSKDVRERIDLNPLRAFDSSHPGTQEVMKEAPVLLDRLEGEDAAHFSAVRDLLDDAGISYTLDGTLVRGLDYYTRTIFEVHSDELGAQSALGGGGRYDGLVSQLGGADTPAVGWSAGVERMLLALGEANAAPARDVFVAAEDDEQRRRAMALVAELRHAGLSAEVDLAGRSMKGQLKHADRIGARHTVVVAAEGAQLRDMESGEQRPVDLAKAVDEIRGI